METMKIIKPWFDRLYYSNLFSRLFHTLVYCLKKELRGCQSVLDLGCGPDSLLKCCSVNFSLGVNTI